MASDPNSGKKDDIGFGWAMQPPRKDMPKFNISAKPLSFDEPPPTYEEQVQPRNGDLKHRNGVNGNSQQPTVITVDDEI
jgi:hypothetical protein